MSYFRFEILAGSETGAKWVIEKKHIRLGGAPDCDVRLSGMPPYIATISVNQDGILIEAITQEVQLRRLRGSYRSVLETGRSIVFLSGDRLCISNSVQTCEILIDWVDNEFEATIVAARKIDETDASKGAKTLGDPERLAQIYEQQLKIGAAVGLFDVLAAIAEAALALTRSATHATIVLRDEASEHAADAFLPMLTRVRGAPQPLEPVAVSRSIFRRVIAERVAILVADAPKDVGASDSLIGASIRSTIAIPLMKGGDLLGVLQIDNRTAPAMLKQSDLETLTVLASSASLAIANAKLYERLRLAEARLNREVSYLRGREASRRGHGREIIGKSQPMTTLLANIDKVANLKVSVLIEGETGTGKELVASALHHRSQRADRLFVTQNCATLPEQLLESELFGHKKGSFTGATEEKKGLFEVADGGTLFLDEVGEMALSLQVKLLRVLQEGEIRPIGATQPRYVDVRIVAATNRSLEKEVAAGRFREDLYYRLKVFPVKVPALRERREDIPLLANHFLNKYSREMGKETGGFAQQTIEMLIAYQWPGNVRELENEVQRLVIQVDTKGIITPELLSPALRKAESLVAKAGVPKGTLAEMLDAVEKHLLLDALREHNNNKTNTAKTLGITREGLHKKLKHFGIS